MWYTQENPGVEFLPVVSLITLPLKSSLEPELADRFFRDIREVFDYFQPEVRISLKTLAGDYVVESFSFRSLGDFDVQGLIAQSPTLTELYKKLTTPILLKNLKHILSVVMPLEESYRGLYIYFFNLNSVSSHSDSKNSSSNAPRFLLRLLHTPLLIGEDLIDETLKVLKGAKPLNIKREIEEKLEVLYSSLASEPELAPSFLVLPGAWGEQILYGERLYSMAEKAHEFRMFIIRDLPRIQSVESIIEQVEAPPFRVPVPYGSSVITMYNHGATRGQRIDGSSILIPSSLVIAGTLPSFYGRENYGTLLGIRMPSLELSNGEVDLLTKAGISVIVGSNRFKRAFLVTSEGRFCDRRIETIFILYQKYIERCLLFYFLKNSYPGLIREERTRRMLKIQRDLQDFFRQAYYVGHRGTIKELSLGLGDDLISRIKVHMDYPGQESNFSLEVSWKNGPPMGIDRIQYETYWQ